jgi:hypothetical protein
MVITRFCGNAAVLLCALLLQNCQTHSLRGIEEEKQAEDSSSSAMCRCAFGEPPAARPLTLYTAPPVAHIPPARSATIPAHEEDRSAALPSRALIPFSPSALAAMGNLPTAPHDLPAAPPLGASYAVPLGSNPDAPSVFTTFSGECVSFIQIDGQWRAAMKTGYGSPTLQRTLPVVGPADVSNFLSWLQDQDKWTSRARIHILKMPQAPHAPCVYLGKAGLLGGVPPSPGQGADPGSRPASFEPFGAEEWKSYLGEVEPAPDLPRDIDTILDAPCPFWPEKMVRDTHLLVLIPAEVNDQLFSLNLLRELIQNLKNGEHSTDCHFDDNVKKELTSTTSLLAPPPEASYWLLMTHDVLPRSRGETYKNQEELVKEKDGNYEIPGVLDAATAILTHYVQNGKKLYEDGDRSTFTRCQKLSRKKNHSKLPREKSHPIIVGGFGPCGLYIVDSGSDRVCESRGMAGCWRFCAAEGPKPGKEVNDTKKRPPQSLSPDSTDVGCENCAKKGPNTTSVNGRDLSTAPSSLLLNHSVPPATLATVNLSTGPGDSLAVAKCPKGSAGQPDDESGRSSPPPGASSRPSNHGSGHIPPSDSLCDSSIGGLDRLKERSLPETIGGEEDEHTKYLDFLLYGVKYKNICQQNSEIPVVTQDDGFRRYNLKILGDALTRTSSDRVLRRYLPSLCGIAEDEDESQQVCLKALEILGELAEGSSADISRLQGCLSSFRVILSRGRTAVERKKEEVRLGALALLQKMREVIDLPEEYREDLGKCGPKPRLGRFASGRRLRSCVSRLRRGRCVSKLRLRNCVSGLRLWRCVSRLRLRRRTSRPKFGRYVSRRRRLGKWG